MKREVNQFISKGFCYKHNLPTMDGEKFKCAKCIGEDMAKKVSKKLKLKLL
jgi:hypothetical protein